MSPVPPPRGSVCVTPHLTDSPRVAGEEQTRSRRSRRRGEERRHDGPTRSGPSRTCAVTADCEEAGSTKPTRGARRRPPPSGTERAGAGAYSPDAAGIGPVAGHARGQQQGRHGLIEKEVVVDKLLLLRLRHAFERIVPPSQVTVQARQGCEEARSEGRVGSCPNPPPPRALGHPQDARSAWLEPSPPDPERHGPSQAPGRCGRGAGCRSLRETRAGRQIRARRLR